MSEYTVYNQNDDEVSLVENPGSYFIQGGKHWFTSDKGTKMSFDSIEYHVVKTLE